jgi:SNF2 family DNA or RNA helicase
MIGTEAMSLGLNFTSADVVINFDDNWSPSVMSQREDRSHRLGQKRVVTVVNFICLGTIEERIRSVIYGKSKISASVLGDDTEEAILQRMNPREIAKLL